MKDLQIGIPCGPNSEKFANFLIKNIEKTISKTKSYSYVLAINKPNVDKNLILKDLDIEVKFIERYSDKVKSEGHADALNLILENIESDYAFFIDSDVAFLKKEWDVLLLQELVGNIVMVGSEYHSSDGKMVNRPNVITCAMSIKKMKNLKIDFMPSLEHIVLDENNCHYFGKNVGETIFLDTGCDMISTLISSGYDTKTLKIISPRYANTHSSLKFLKINDRGEEYQLMGEPICTHIGRSLSRNFETDPIVKKWKDSVERWVDGEIR